MLKLIEFTFENKGPGAVLVAFRNTNNNTRDVPIPVSGIGADTRVSTCTWYSLKCHRYPKQILLDRPVTIFNVLPGLHSEAFTANKMRLYFYIFGN